ncbi:MAG TPA: methylated-DNA--[protein]-cysteine S-methyltransferase [Micromonosporaceae bacterium]|nr:methylated-DNA--[protein]-cysteine S-methyltransferase [Micromonosporaceae bacterium]
MLWTVTTSPIGELAVAADDAGLCRVRFSPHDVTADPAAAGAAPLARAVEQLAAYFAGELTEFDLPLSVRGGSDFERAVWAALRDIPYGEMRTYGEIAVRAGDPGAARAVGVACNRNPLALVVPCHRVVGAGGKLVGFGGGLDRKRHLLELESGVAMRQLWAAS